MIQRDAEKEACPRGEEELSLPLPSQTAWLSGENQKVFKGQIHNRK
jgi:hypothetical protein